MDFLSLKNKLFVITGVSNAKSIAYRVAQILKAAGAEIIFSVQNEKNLEKVQCLFPQDPCFICDVESETAVKDFGLELGEWLAQRGGVKLGGMLHSLAYANLLPGRPFHQTSYADLEQAARISCFSLIKLADVLKEYFCSNAAVVTISISSTRATAYGFLGPIKAMLDATVPFLAKSFAEFSEIRFNAVGAGPLKTSASAGIPNYLDNYIYAEQLTLRRRALLTEEVANVAAFLLAPCSSGINGQTIIVDGGISSNYFDSRIVKTVVDHLPIPG
ncbi:MAG: SDR family oxidoreductase [Oligoflexia bacterium]|nr:SDR family oxidoreductase [Oligoflexia bacterium]